MKMSYNVTGADRKELVKKMAEILGTESKYLGAPSMAYSVGDFKVTKEGAVECEDGVDVNSLIEALKEAGYEGEAEYTETEEASYEAEVEAEAEALEEDAEETEATEEADEAETGDEPTELNIEMPRSFFTDEALENLQKIVDSKANLIKKSVGADELPINIGEEKVSFPWFKTGSAEDAKAYGDLISRMSVMAKEAKRVTAKEKEVESEAYAFRCFLVRLGMSGNEYKATRKVLMRNLDGPSAFPNKAAADAFAAKQKEKRDAAKAVAQTAGEEA